MSEHYTQLTRELEKIVKEAPRTSPGDIIRTFEQADRMFAGMNNNCVKTAKP